MASNLPHPLLLVSGGSVLSYERIRRCVLLDDLGPPWPVHPCWQEYRDERRRAIVTCTDVLVNFGVGILREPTLGSVINAAVPQEDWWHFGPDDDLRQWLRRLEYELVYTLKPPPVPADPEERGPFLIMTWVVTHADRYFFSTDLPRTDSAWVAVDTASKDLVVFVPEEIRRQLKAGDPFIAEIQAVGGGIRCEYVAARIRSKEGGRIDIL